MKREFENLQRDARAREQDEVVRSELVRNETTNASAAAKQDKEEKLVAHLKACLKKWEDMGLECLRNRTVTFPDPNVVGPPYPSYSPLSHAL